MKAEKLILTSVVKGRTQVLLWDVTSPISLGHPIRWVLERTDSGVRIRNLLSADPAIQLGEDVIDGKTSVQLPHSELQISLKRVRPIRAAYLDGNSTLRTKEAPVLMAFSGVRRSVVSSLEIHTAYVAYCKGKPAFTVHNDENGIKINLLSNKLCLKKKGQPAVSGAPGETWKVSSSELASVTITRDWYWWRFNLVSPSKTLSKSGSKSAEDRFQFKAMASLVGALLLFFVLGQLFHKDQPVTQEIPIEAPKREKIVVYRTEGALTPVPQTGNPAAQVQAPTQEPVKSSPPAQQTVAKAAGGQANAHTRVTDHAANLAKAQTKTLKDALGGAASMLKNISTPGSSAASFSGLFSNNGPVVSQTQVKPGITGSNAKVGKIGGNGAGGAGSGSGDSVGYANGEHGAVSGQGTSLVSDGIGGSTVNDGLTKEQVGAVIHSHMNEIRYCHELALLGNPGIQGKLTVDFSISPSGRVESSSVQASTLLPDTSIQTCLLRRLSGWRFPNPRGGVHVNVSYPFVFKTLSRE